MNTKTEMLCANSGIFFVTLFGIGLFFITGWLPPVDPALSASAIDTLFEEDRIRIMIGASVVAFIAPFWWVFSSAIASQMRYIEGPSHPLTYLQLASATGTVFIFHLSAYFWLAGSFRPDLPADTLRTYNDLAWLLTVGAYSPPCLQLSTIGVCILNDDNPRPIFPRWSGYASLWTATLLLPGILVPFFTTGPFSWKGIVGFWIVAIAFFVWIILMWHLTRQAIKTRHEREQSETD